MPQKWPGLKQQMKCLLLAVSELSCKGLSRPPPLHERKTCSFTHGLAFLAAVCCWHEESLQHSAERPQTLIFCSLSSEEKKSNILSKNYMRPPRPSSPIFGQKALLRGPEGGEYFEPPRGRNCAPPPLFYTSPTPRINKQGSPPTPWARGLRDQIEKRAGQRQKTLYSSSHRIYSAQKGIGTMISDHGLGRGQTMV